jgi:hypothetical protein
VWSLGREESGIRSGEVKGFCELPATAKTCGQSRAWWVMPGISATWEAGWGGWSFKVSPGKKLSSPHLNKHKLGIVFIHIIPAMLEAGRSIIV